MSLLADRAYDSGALPVEMAARGAWANIRPMWGGSGGLVALSSGTRPMPRAVAVIG